MKSSEQSTNRRRAEWRGDSDLLAELIVEGAQRGVREAIADHHRAGNPVAIWRDGGIVLLHPDGSTTPVNGDGTTEEAANGG